MQDLERFKSACRSHADYAYSLPDLVDVAGTELEARFEDGMSPSDAIDQIAKDMGLTHRDNWNLDKAVRLISSIVGPSVVVPFKRN